LRRRRFGDRSRFGEKSFGAVTYQNDLKILVVFGTG
jgi:hypothetical protein